MSTCCSTARCNGDGRRYFHQLFHHLRETPLHQTLRDTVSGDLGNCEDLLDNRQVQSTEELQHCVDHLRHRSIEDLHHRCKLRRILHDVPLHTPLRLHLDEECWPHPRGKSRLSP